MKSYFKAICGAIIIGSILAFIFYLDIKKEVVALTNNDDCVTIVQVGVYQNKNNALASACKYPSALIYQDQDYYRVFIGITINNQNKLTDYFQQKGYDFYLKKIPVKKEIYQKINEYDNVLTKTNDDKAILALVLKMGELFLEKDS